MRKCFTSATEVESPRGVLDMARKFRMIRDMKHGKPTALGLKLTKLNSARTKERFACASNMQFEETADRDALSHELYYADTFGSRPSAVVQQGQRS